METSEEEKSALLALCGAMPGRWQLADHAGGGLILHGPIDSDVFPEEKLLVSALLAAGWRRLQLFENDVILAKG